MTIHIRLATLQDIPALAPLFDAYRQFYEQPSDIGLATDYLRTRLTNQESVILVASNAEQQLTGFCQLYPSFCSVIAAPIYVLYDLFVSPGARQTGTGKRLMQAAEAEGIRAGKRRLDLTTAKTNLTAQALYEGCGWERDKVFLTYNKNL
ncbi:GNAT family N-acetyltransferase [Leeia oryzae]|uniref:GNAT family N-acetyltransferase n=1 Tax=Leeia oryzae TaxID=356662 RepID=UPI000377152C|nr:GNAT family N-acetyltransferase [Leeia oryzae]